MRDETGIPLVPEFFYVPRDKVSAIVSRGVTCVVTDSLRQRYSKLALTLSRSR